MSPCTASIPSTGDRKCFNCVADCQDRENFDPETVTLRFAVATDYRPQRVEAIPSILDVSYTPAVIDPGRSLGSRAEITITFQDSKHSDVGPGFDKYASDRGYDP